MSIIQRQIKSQIYRRNRTLRAYRRLGIVVVAEHHVRPLEAQLAAALGAALGRREGATVAPARDPPSSARECIRWPK
jgi:hypothetical protein